MKSALLPIFSLLLGTAILFLGGGLYGTLLAIRAGAEGFSAGTVGMIMGGYYAGFILGCLSCPRLINDVGHIRTYAALTAIASAATLAHAVYVDAVFWGVLRAISGFAFAGLYMVIESWLNEKADQETRGRIFAVYMMVSLGALGVGQLLLLTTDSQNFALFCAVSILISLAAVPLSLTRVMPPAIGERSVAALAGLWRISPLGFIACLGVGLGQGVFWSLTPVFTVASGLSENGTAIFMTVTVFGGLVLQWPIGWLSDRYDRRGVLCGVALFTAIVAAGVAYSGARGSEPALMMLAAVYGGTSFAIYSLAVAHANDHSHEIGIVPLSAGLLLVYAVGATVGPFAVGWLVELSSARSIYGFVALVYLLVGAFGVYRMMQRPPVPLTEQGAFVPLSRAGPYAAMIDPRGEDDNAVLDDRTD